MTTSLTELLRTVRSLPLLLVLVPSLSAQTQSAASAPTQSLTGSPSAESPLQFEVASIRPHQARGDDPSDRKMLSGGRFIATATSVRTLIRMAFGVDSVSGTPSWVDSETFDITATTANHVEVTNPQQFQQLILSLLEDRFQLKFHRGQKEVPVYWLELDKPGKLGPTLKPSAPDSQPNMSNNSNGSKVSMRVSKMSMADIATGLRRQTGRPVEDHTNLKGNFDFQIEWAREEIADSAEASLFTVLKEQLGLKLRSAKGTTDTVVINQISRPSAN